MGTVINCLNTDFGDCNLGYIENSYVWDISDDVAWIPLESFGRDRTLYIEFGDDVDFGNAKKQIALIGYKDLNGGTGMDAFAIQTVLGLPQMQIRNMPYSSNEVGDSTTRFYTDIQTQDALYKHKDKGFLIFGDSITCLSNMETYSIVGRKATGVVSKFNGYLQLNAIRIADASNIPVYPSINSWKTNKELTDAVLRGDVTNGEPKIKFIIKRLIVFANKKYNTVEEVISNRYTADIDIRFKKNGTPYNAGSSGNLVFSDVNNQFGTLD